MYLFSAYLGFQSGGSQGVGIQFAHAVFAVGSSKFEVSKTYYFDIVLT